MYIETYLGAAKQTWPPAERYRIEWIIVSCETIINKGGTADVNPFRPYMLRMEWVF